MTVRKLSVWEESWIEMQSLRVLTLRRLGLPELAEEQPIARLNSILAQATKQLLVIAGERETKDAEIFLIWAWEEYLRSEWGATLTPPFALSGFANPTMLSRCWAAVEAGLAEDAALDAFTKGAKK